MVEAVAVGAAGGGVGHGVVPQAVAVPVGDEDNGAGGISDL
jgi:hypothetical protein